MAATPSAGKRSSIVRTTALPTTAASASSCTARICCGLERPNPTASGSLNFSNWALLGKTVRRHQFNSVYAMADKQFGRLRMQAGARYLTEKLPSIDVYNTAGIGNVSYDQALAASSGVIASRSAVGPVFHELLPYLALGYRLNPDTTLKLNIGRNYGAPSFDVWPVYQMNAALRAKYTAQQIWDRLQPEISYAVFCLKKINYADGYLETQRFLSTNPHKGCSLA